MALVGAFITIFSSAPPPYNILGYMLSVGVKDDLAEPNTDFSVSNAIDGALLGLSQIKFKDKNFTKVFTRKFSRLGFIKSTYESISRSKELVDYEDMAITIEKDGIYDTQRYRFDPTGKLFSKTDISVYSLGIPPNPISRGQDVPIPDITLATGEKYYFNNKN
ncbi:hypothetical protein IMX26_03450 [Clostridium sp. 'deep sea']|uniref:hypothetical protein n=1 Tax=Clostridium sp. 'deep sea' TaxID=2779445 RepID=UPI0018966D0C|nr:hypothetical protein [Clostridium sp. 'deep sea']QOR35887.1 hypothetical protein IMX26_03450 [Clostridium sp. 'deep sea']